MRPSPAPQRQQGVVLAVALILLVVMMLVGLAATRSVSVEEKMSAATYDRNLAFQAAEAALRWGEAKATEQARGSPANHGFETLGSLLPGEYTDIDKTACPIPPPPCRNGLCNTPDANCVARWLDPDFTGWQAVSVADLGLDANLLNQPRYFIEMLGRGVSCQPENATLTCVSPPPVPMAVNCDCFLYRVTAESDQGSGRSRVMLQSVLLTK